jgi:glycosyltransferase involved in cell wall biosynthesis
MKLHLVIPCFNEEASLPTTISRLTEYLGELISRRIVAPGSQITFVDDGSSDGSWSLIERASSDSSISGIKLSRNQGHQSALLAGLLTVDGDIVVSLDADLQDDVSVIEEMIAAAVSGYDIVVGVRVDRSSDSIFKRTTARLFYWLLPVLGVQSVPGHADYRLMTRRGIEALRQYPEVNLFLRGLVPLIGFRTKTVQYRRLPRLQGATKYSLRKMIALAIEAVTSFSTVPLQFIGILGLVIFLGTMAVSAWAAWIRIFTDSAVPGWASTVLPLYFLGGVQLLGIGVLGVYLGKIYQEVKRRPRYIVEQTIGIEADAGVGDIVGQRYRSVNTSELQ